MTKNTSTPARTLADWEINQYTKFLPYVPASENNGAEALPCVEIGGDENGDGAMQVYVYAENGGVHVSLHYDSAGPTEEDGSGPWAYYGPDRDLIPTVVTGGGDEPVYVAREGVPDLSDELVNDALAPLAPASGNRCPPATRARSCWPGSWPSPAGTRLTLPLRRCR
jgi:hypothetical protein